MTAKKKPKPVVVWAVVSARGNICFTHRTKSNAVIDAKSLNMYQPQSAPYRIVRCEEVSK